MARLPIIAGRRTAWRRRVRIPVTGLILFRHAVYEQRQLRTPRKAGSLDGPAASIGGRIHIRSPEGAASPAGLSGRGAFSCAPGASPVSSLVQNGARWAPKTAPLGRGEGAPIRVNPWPPNGPVRAHAISPAAREANPPVTIHFVERAASRVCRPIIARPARRVDIHVRESRR